MTNNVSDTQTVIFAGGCFWCTEAVFGRVRGVVSVESGYIGGHVDNPSYKAVCTGETGHAEAVRVTFLPAEVALGDLYDIFFATHDPTQLNRQGNDIGTQYRSAIFPDGEAQLAEAKAAIARAQAERMAPVVTTVEPIGPFFVAEVEHQDYYARIGDRNPYCAAVITPKLSKFMKTHADRLKPDA